VNDSKPLGKQWSIMNQCCQDDHVWPRNSFPEIYSKEVIQLKQIAMLYKNVQQDYGSKNLECRTGQDYLLGNQTSQVGGRACNPSTWQG
jgi:hypothetical protein